MKYKAVSLAVLGSIAAILSGCTMTDNSTGFNGGVNSTSSTSTIMEGQFVPLGRAVYAGRLRVTPIEIVEDSRCPVDVECVWEGTVQVLADVEYAGRSERVTLELGNRRVFVGVGLTLTEVRPDRRSTTTIREQDYRLKFVAG